jgi:predicted DNA-binding antitoxin AbrB/MazE fold protein
MSAISCKAVYEDGVFRPVEPVGGIPEHTCVDVVVTVPAGAGEKEPVLVRPAEARRRVLGLNRGELIHIAEDFDAPLGDDFWFGQDRTGAKAGE